MMVNPDWKLLFKEGFDFDLFANRAWLPCIQSGTEEEKVVFKHLLAASRIWASRCQGIALESRPDVPITEDAINELHSDWVRILDTAKFEQMIEFRTFMGDEYSRSFGDLVRHVLNHGTYHRGQLREMMGARGAEFPDTDFLDFVWERDGG